jgi:Flp pilus assembly protein TadG
MMFLAGTIDLGRAFFTYMAMRDAVQEGASFASISPANASAIEERARTSSTFPVDLTMTDIDVTSTVTGTGCAGDTVTVSMTYDQFPLVFPFSNLIFGQNYLTLATSVSDTILLPLCP